MVKFDVRSIILQSSVEPLKVFAYTRFWLMFANIPFSLDKLDRMLLVLMKEGKLERSLW